MRWLAALEPQPRKVLKVNSLSTMVRACRAGVGMALLPCIMGAQEGLLRIGETVEVQRDIWLLSHRDTGSIARFKTVSAWLSHAYACTDLNP
jgi:DNA-binding transcriptional LysR family regulator